MKTRFQIVAEAKRIRAESLQILTDAEHWNTSIRKPHEAVIDADPRGELAAIIAGIDAMLANEIRISEPQ